jgi:hypothetical protein
VKHPALLLALVFTLTPGAPPALAAEPLGRFFFTPDQRTSLDTARTKKARTTVGTEEGATEKPPPAPQPEHVTYGGLVRRSDGKTTVWLNDQVLQDKDLRSGSSITGRIRPDGSVTLQGAQSGRSVELKVGQSAELLSGTVEERYMRPAPKPEARPEDKPAVKPGADASGANQAALERAKEERAREERRRDMEDAVRALQNAAPVKPEVSPAPAPQQPSR